MITQQQVLDAVRRLPPRQRQRLSEKIIQQTVKSPSVTLVAIKRLAKKKQRRLDALADKNTEGRLTTAERTELRRLVAEAQYLALENARALARAQRSELFDDRGQPIKRRVREAVRAKARADHAATTRSRRHGK